MKKQELLSIIESKGFTLENHGTSIGFKYPNKHVFHWFSVEDNDDVIFSHSYSMNTGGSDNSMNQRWRVIQSLRFTVRIKHDHGIHNVKCVAPDKESAKKQIMAVESCPESAIISVK